MDCKEARTYLVDRRRGTLTDDQRSSFEEHLASCPSCRHERAADDELSFALAQRLMHRRAPDALRRSLHERWDVQAARADSAPPANVRHGAEPELRPGRSRRLSVPRVVRTLSAMAAGAAIALLVVVGWPRRGASDAMVTEAVNDHLRVLYSEHPLGVESGGIHQVKPWFEGRLDFAPVVPFDEDDEFVLQGGAVAYFLDRKAATFVYKRRLHAITLFVFRAEGLAWPIAAQRSVGDSPATLTASRGFHVLMWHKGDLGYALVSDVDERELAALGARIAGAGGR